MTVTNAPGYDEAIKHGYDQIAFSPMSGTTYFKDDMYLTIKVVNGEMEAELSAIWGLISLTIDNIKWPNDRFQSYEDKMVEALYRLGKA